ncbi:aldehyde dehydrogenase family protein [Sphingomonas sp. Leaf4]|uniref:aldehyde dehydrogenase family protein n=1 Tax=Sphingomonas sp. Leaf4 TaxID=2876553 RepID=UPI001E2FEF5D|nr:aldehyde dehydrogenase family protein [Sphingomonas sp. Leaf4]
MTEDRTGYFYIGGDWREPIAPATPIAVVDPATETSIGAIAAGSAADVDRAVAAGVRAFPAFAASPVADRIALLGRIAALLEERAESFARAIATEMGAAISFARASQVPFAIAHVRAQIEVLEQYHFERPDTGFTTVKEAIGVAALITPWNWPLYQITAKVAPALAAGCPVVLKPSEVSPYSALLFAQVMHDAGCPAGVFNLVNGTGEVVGAALSAHPDVAMISITGSTRAGVLVAQAAAVSVKRVVQELGGKSPNLFLDDADFAAAVPRGVMAGMRNVGQSCSAPTRLLVPAHRLAEVEALAIEAAGQWRVGAPLDDTTTMGPIANAAQHRRVQAMIETGMAEGARLICGGPGRPADLNRGYYARPTIFSNVTPTMTIAREEIFGPVLCILPYADEEAAIGIANDTVYGLGAHVQSGDPARAQAVARRIRAGQVHINSPAWTAHAPFGGYKQSGNGREYGVHGFEEYLETKAILA